MNISQFQSLRHKAAVFSLTLLCSSMLPLFAGIDSGKASKRTKVILAPSTFTSAELNDLQPVADQVTQLVDTLIPGTPPDYPSQGIVCFEAPPRWRTVEYGKHFSAPPVTINGPHVFDEPPEAPGNTLRIALNELPQPNRWSFAFQLAHELAHVKMGPRTDNYLDETFAVALSFEVLRRLGYEGYLLESEGFYLKTLPPAPQEALASNRWEAARAYWLEHVKTQDRHLDDRGFQGLGALLILRNSNHLRWAELLNASSANVCSSATPANTFAVCDPDVSRMDRQSSFLRPLGLAAVSRSRKHDLQPRN